MACSLRHAGSFAVAHGLFIVVRGLFVVVCGLLSSCSVQVPEHVGSVVCSTRALVEARELSSCGTQA